MTELLTDRQWASFDWEALLPILFFVIYAISQVVGGKKKGGEEAVDPDGEETDAMERARQIREEIRRKIAERQGGGADRNPDTAPTAPAAPRRGYDPTVAEPLQRPQPEVLREPVPSPRAAPAPQPAAVEPAEPSGDGGGILKRLHEQRQRLAEARREQEKARQSARAMENRAFAKTASRRPAKSLLVEAPTMQAKATGVRAALLADLADPVSIRKAIVLREVLDKPVGLR